MKQDRVGVVVFAGEAKVQLPITTDYRMARSFTKRLSPELVEVQGTDVSDAIDLASLSFSQREDASRVMILITDGEAHDADALDAAERAARKKDRARAARAAKAGLLKAVKHHARHKHFAACAANAALATFAIGTATAWAKCTGRHPNPPLPR